MLPFLMFFEMREIMLAHEGLFGLEVRIGVTLQKLDRIFGRLFSFAVEDLVERDDLACVRRHASHRGDDARLHAAF